MENRSQECQLDLFGDRTSAATMRANHLRPWFASMAYVLLCAVRRIGLAHTQFAQVASGTIRLKLPKIGAPGAGQRTAGEGRDGVGLPLSARIRLARAMLASAAR